MSNTVSRPRKGQRIVLGVIITVIVLAAAAALGINWLLGAPSDTPAPVEFEVLPGWSANRVAAELKEHGLVRSAQAFGWYLRWQDLDRSIGEGLYDLDPAMDTQTVARTLAAGGRPRIVRVVVPEGFRASDVITRLVDAGLGEASDYVDLDASPVALGREYLQEDPPVPADAPVAYQRLEGYLFPASYDIPVNSTPAQVIDLFLDRFDAELDEATLARLGELGLSIREWVILASVVQSEAGSVDEMPIIAGVFLNRLGLDMPLQSDPTVAYGLGKTMPELSVPEGDMRSTHPWNTYFHAELPAGPISNPGSDALAAVLNAELENDDGEPWLYFLHGTDDGEPVFRPNATYEAHMRDIELYLR